MSTVQISAADVNKLRQQTGAGMMDCKKALVEANGDFEAAVDLLRKKVKKYLQLVLVMLLLKVWYQSLFQRMAQMVN
jgi:hypothetical protein